MKRRALLTAVGAAALGWSCRRRRDFTAKAASSTESPRTERAPGSPAVLARIGGMVTRGQSYFAELLVFRSGRLEAALSDPEGHALNEPAEVSIELATRGAGRVTVPLRYAPRRERFQGSVARGVELVSERALLQIEHNERRDAVSVARTTILRGPERGGHMFNVGELGVELIPEASGALDAWVHDAEGSLVTDPKLRLEATLLTESLEKHRVALAWDSTSTTYRGVASRRLRPGPLELSTPSARARIQQASLAPAPAHGGQVLLVGFHAVELVLRTGEASVFVSDAFGKPYPAGHLGLVLAFEAEPQPSLHRLTWDEKTFSYRAALPRRDPAGTAVSVWLTAGEHADFGAAASR